VKDLSSDELRHFYEGKFLEFELQREYEKDIFTRSRLKAFGKMIPPMNREARCLDVGCGLGHPLQELRSRGEAIGMDLSIRSLLETRKRCPNTPLCQGLAEGLPFPSGSFSGVVAMEVIEHTPDPWLTIKELCRVSSDWLLLSFPTDHDWLYSRLGVVKNPYADLNPREMMHTHVGHISVPRIADVREKLTSNGFSITQIRGHFWLLPPPFKLGFHYPALSGARKRIFSALTAADNLLGMVWPFTRLGLNTILLANRNNTE